jgi:RNA polymerase sigma-70 factor (ECF subfamily)
MNTSSNLLPALERHYEELVDYVRRRFSGRGFERDVVHDLCVQLIDNPPEGDIRAPLAFLRRASANRATDWTRAEAVRNSVIDVVADLPETAVHHDDGAQLLQGSQELAALVRIIEALPARARQVFLLHRVHEMPQQAIAEAIGISRNMVAQHFARAMRAIESDWEPARRLPPRRAQPHERSGQLLPAEAL